MEIVHFAHEHPLSLNKSGEIPHGCNACGLRVLSSPYYFCAIQDCNFYLHQACTQLPHRLYHSVCISDFDFVQEHSLTLLAKPRDDNCRCGDCGKVCKSFTYHCSRCDFVLHPQCGSKLDIQIKHISHPEHPMVAICKEALLLCDVCGREHMGYFFSCQQCNFWIHQDCAVIPSLGKVEGHPHHLSLVYRGESLLGIYIDDSKCLICREKAIKRFGLYFCSVCYCITHVDCATSHMKDTGAILHMRMTLDDTFPSLIIRTGVKAMAVQQSNSKDMIGKYHAHHPLVLIDGTAQESICNVCIKPISPPYYICSAQSECNFLLHKFCAELPLSVKHPCYELLYPAILASPRWDGLFSPFQCDRCRKNNNGFRYVDYYNGIVDIDCAFAPSVITHDSHKEHPLALSSYSLSTAHVSCCGGPSSYKYHCRVCNFGIHIDCARLPASVTHKFDEHPLTLIFASSSQHDSNSRHQDMCEFCEEDIDLKYWFYHCDKCDQSFHVNCIPSTGEYSRIKFGGTMKVPCHKDHPLTLVRTMDVGSQTCGFCQEIVEGFKDGMALHRADCDFWIHLDCGYKSSGAIDPRELKPFSELGW